MNKIENKYFDSKISYCDTTFINCEFKVIALSSFINCNFINCNFNYANLTNSSFIDCIFKNTSLIDANLLGANFSGSSGLLDPYKWLKKNFEFTRNGIIVYKVFGLYNKKNNKWITRPGSIIEEEINFNRTNNCGCGINVATLDWIKKEPIYIGKKINGLDLDIWKLIIPPDGIFSICVPYNTDGKFRCGKAKLLEIVG